MPIFHWTVLALSQIGGTVGVETAPSTNSLTFQSIVAGTGLGAQKPAINAGTQPYLSATSSTISSLSSGFTIQETLAVTLNVKLDQMNYSSATTLTSVPVPEPSTMAIAGLGALDMIGYGLRRRKVLALEPIPHQAMARMSQTHLLGNVSTLGGNGRRGFSFPEEPVEIRVRVRVLGFTSAGIVGPTGDACPSLVKPWASLFCARFPLHACDCFFILGSDLCPSSSLNNDDHGLVWSRG